MPELPAAGEPAAAVGTPALPDDDGTRSFRPEDDGGWFVEVSAPAPVTGSSSTYPSRETRRTLVGPVALADEDAGGSAAGACEAVG